MEPPLDVDSAAHDPSDASPPKKYIRTFAGDMETVKKGDVPDLAPLPPPPSAPSPTLPAPSVATPPPEVAAAPKPEVPQESASAEAVDKPPQADLKTYAGDFSDRMKETNASTATILAAEQNAAPEPFVENIPVPQSRRAALYVGAGAVFLLLGAIGAYLGYARYAAETEPIPLAPAVPTPIPVNEREEITATTPLEIQQTIIQSAASMLAPNAVRLLYLSTTTTAGDSVFSALKLLTPDILLRNIDAAKSMAGIVHTESGQSVFFILSVASYGDTFAGMLAWEPTMLNTLGALFAAHEPPPVPLAESSLETASTSSAQATSTTTATTTTAKKSVPKTATSTVPAFTAGFRDEVIDNHDARVYRDTAGRSVFLYGYWNPTTLVIARDASAFADILGRLATSRALD